MRQSIRRRPGQSDHVLADVVLRGVDGEGLRDSVDADPPVLGWYTINSDVRD